MVIGGERIVTVSALRAALDRFPGDQGVFVGDARGRLRAPILYQDTAGLPGPEVVVIEGLD